jgi:hypothetical protein
MLIAPKKDAGITMMKPPATSIIQMAASGKWTSGQAEAIAWKQKIAGARTQKQAALI